jgi:phosphoribosylanthranilate isomerase
MSLWIKICGTTSLDDALLAADAGADVVGFVFAPSPRRVTVPQVAAITPKLPDAIEKIGVFVDAAFDEIESAVRAGGLTGVQFHCDADNDTPQRLRESFGASLRIVRVVHFGADAAARAAAIDRDANVDAILVDSRTATARGGTGVSFDWAAARSALFESPNGQKIRRIAAGGLSPANVAQAIAALRPWGVDVASGVESSPGRKDSKKVREFIANARAASRRR